MTLTLTFKLLGAALVLVSSISSAAAISVRGRHQLKELDGFILLLRHIRLSIACFMQPLGDIYSGFNNDALQRCGFITALRAGDFSSALTDCTRTLSISSRQRELLASLGEQLGRSYRDEQVGACDYYLSLLDAEYKSCEAALPKKSKLSRSLCIMCGLTVIIIFI